MFPVVRPPSLSLSINNIDNDNDDDNVEEYRFRWPRLGVNDRAVVFSAFSASVFPRPVTHDDRPTDTRQSQQSPANGNALTTVAIEKSWRVRRTTTADRCPARPLDGRRRISVIVSFDKNNNNNN